MCLKNNNVAEMKRFINKFVISKLKMFNSQQINRMKNIMVFFVCIVYVFGISCRNSRHKTDQVKSNDFIVEEISINELNQSEKNEGWVLLFDGKTTEGWRGVNKSYFPTGWEVVNGTLFCKQSGQGDEGGDILYEKEFSNFHLKMDWKISEGGKSGVFYLGKEVEDWPVWKTAPEMQLIDNENNPEALIGNDGTRKAGSLYGLIAANPQNSKPAGEWNTIEIQSYKGTIVHKQNGETVLEYHLWSDDWNNLVAGSRFEEVNPDWANVASSGFIALQNQGDAVWFRNIKIKEL
jgi:hypothetical protein